MTIQFLSFDIDNTLIDEGSLDGNFSEYWMLTPPEQRPKLCYNTGRLLNDTLHLIKSKVLPTPDFIISGVGTNIYDFKEKKILKEFAEILEEGWNIQRVQELVSELPFSIKKQPQQFQHDYKQSYYLESALPQDIQYIEQQFKLSELDINVVYSGEKFLDILPKWANKGNALSWLLRQLDILVEHTLVAGDSGNDNSMFALPGVRGIVVGNARQELYQLTKRMDVFHAEKHRSEGILEGLRFYNLIPEEVMSSVHSEQKKPEYDHSSAADFVEYADENVLTDASEDELSFIREGYQKALEAIRYNITPMGFSACSLEHNSTRGTDANYRSVWARDGAITISGTIPILDDEQIRTCQIATFNTLLNHISPNGQVPANVSIDTDIPDYSGVGGICSIDSGLWVIIAFYEYIKATRDLDFLRQHLHHLQSIMDWLSAHDSNNDALLEIPEAGDWTDLLGRSYNVLYDEVLWYHTNICFGRLLEMTGNSTQAGDYIRWSQVIKKEILLHFWPSTAQKLFQTVSFAEQQYSLGDSQYLIAQVTPFNFSWRCDVYGNLLAYLYNVLDKEKATLAFRFMWGVGANDPYPVNNLYPVIGPGDPDWRAYYTVNLLNLPYHYHNGGIWPFIGAAWVRFIDKLGLKNIAIKELYKLAQLNKLGINNEWEFNEWAHGSTGRPMGKIYQAWSAAQYILACHELRILDKKI
ncbi:MAG: HAD-IIB family hydrolase [Saprospiraceae bacterium]|nr:HAD-IIB family hydrolase [Saprospiraceae bacterium]